MMIGESLIKTKFSVLEQEWRAISFLLHKDTSTAWLVSESPGSLDDSLCSVEICNFPNQKRIIKVLPYLVELVLLSSKVK